ncbi:MAG: NAD+ synthase [Candidatus Omnitrophota bacterium]
MKKALKFAIAQMNPTVGDYAENTRKIIAWIGQAEKKGADLIVFPEAALCGYPVWDLANKKQFVDEGLKCLSRIAAATRGKKVAAVIGFIDKERAPSAILHPSSFNALAWIEKGKVRTVYHKQLLPTYDVFLEDIFFRPGHESGLLSWKGRKVGLTICEDIWDERYPVKPLQALKKQKADLVINLSASPYYRGVAGIRDAQLKGQSVRYGLPMLYVNQVGGQDDLLFDGRSVFCDAKGRILFRAPAFEEGLFFYNWNSCTPRRCTSGQPREVPLPEWTGKSKETYNALVMGLRDYFRKNGFTKAVIGLSGGIDSALVATLAVDALGADAVKGVTMPGPFSSEGSWKDSEQLAKNLGIAFEVKPIKKMYETFLKSECHEPRATGHGRSKKRGAWSVERVPNLAMENLQARLRGLELMFLSNHEGRLVLTTGNKSELAMGYCTLYGDMAGGLAVIGDVYKTDVYRLAHYRNTIRPVIPEATLTKAPSAELRPDQKDEDSLPPYEVLDAVLHLYIEKNLSRDAILRTLKNGASAAIIADVIRKVDHNEYKRRQTPPVLRVSEKAWFGRRMPITNRFSE